MNKLVASLNRLKNSPVKETVEARIKEFSRLQGKPDKEIFKELCFCILTANYRAQRCIWIQKEVDDGFLTIPEPQLAAKLRKLGYRFPKTRARYIVQARKYASSLKSILENLGDSNSLREWFVKNIKGLGYKEASHFLRNIGYTDLAIVDFHIVDLLERYGMLVRPKAITRKDYLNIEHLLKKISRESGLNLAKLDLYLWFMETGKILK